jgi:hypothetical protein
MGNLSPNNSEYFHAFRACFNNRDDLVDTINNVDYILSEIRDRPITINDLFLEKNDNLGMRCAKLLLQQVRCQYQLLNHIPHNGDLQILLDEFSMDGGCIKHLLSNEVTNHVHDLKMSEAQTNVHISFAKTSTRLKPINCQSLVNFTDKFLKLIIKKLQIHQEDCELGLSCVRCNSFTDEDIDVHKLTPLLEDFGSYFTIDEVQNEETDTTDYRDLTNPRDYLELNVSFNQQAPALQEEYSWERFKDIVLKKYKDLKQHYEENVDYFKDMELPVVILYTDTKGVFKVANCASIPEARLKANSLEDMSKDLFPVVLISTTDYKLPDIVSRKRMVQKFNFYSSSKVGQEDTPSLPGTLQTPPGREPFEFPMLFYLDTGADTGSVGYNYHIIKHFILTVENINGALEPAILCSFNSAKITSEEVQVFDVDQHSNWNAIGLSVLKNYRIYLDIRNGRVEIGRHEDVTENESDETFEVIFKKDIVLNSSPFPDDL